MNYCMIGTGVAAVNAAKAIRDHEQDAKIHVFGTEKFLPYNRIKLSKDLFSDLSSEKVLIKKEKWYETQNIHIYPNTEIVKIDTDQHTLTTSTNQMIHYDKLLICTGAKNRKLSIDGVDKRGVFTIREMHEAEDFKAYLTDKTNVVMIGGGSQGLETAWSLYKAGKKVSIVEVAPRLMANQLDEKTSEILKNKIEAAGLDIHLQASVNEIMGENEVEGIVIGDSTIACESVIYSIGVIPNLDVVAHTSIHTNRGIIVNGKMETNIEDVYAAGDVSELHGEVAGLWNRAMDQGKIAGMNMTGANVDYQGTLPVAIFNAFNLSLFSIGLVDENQCDLTMIEEEGNDKYTRIYIKDHKIVGVISLDGVVASIPYKKAIESQVSLAGLDLNNMTINEVMSEVKDRLTTVAV